MQHKWLTHLFLSLVVGFTTISSVAAQEPQPAATADTRASASGTPIGTAITYQGQLKQNGAPANGNFDFQFILYDAVSGGNQQGATLQLNNIAVSNGVFNVQVDFGQTVFNGEARFLEVGVKPVGSTAAYTILSPRTLLGAVPYALGMPGVTAQNGVITVGGQLYMTGEDFVMLPTARGDGGRAIVHDGGDTLVLNYASDFSGGTRVGSSLHVDGNLGMGGVDFVMAANGRGDGGRAIVHDGGDTLVLNYANDFPGGTRIDSSLSVGGNLRFSGQKMCSVLIPGNWRDTILVSNDWSIDTCRRFRDTVGASEYQLACVFGDDFSFGNPNGGAPSNNCGW